jgi:CspA family cold shock protein
MPQGVIKKLISDKGFGFISRDDGNDLFFHHSAVEGVEFDSLREGQTVEFTVGQGPKGPAAEVVRATD